MRYARIFICLFFILSALPFQSSPVRAASITGVSIAQMYPGASGAASQEFIELYNSTTTPVDVTGWCVYYISSSGATTTKLACLTPPDNSTKLWLGVNGYAVLASKEYELANAIKSDAAFESGIASTAGHIRLVDATGVEVDRLGWGSPVNPETTATGTPANGTSLQRKSTGTSMKDTDNNNEDFVSSVPIVHVSGMYEVVTVVDLCPNIPEVQQNLPNGYLLDPAGDCQIDSCLNLPGLQTSVPNHYDSAVAGTCTLHDECENISGVQEQIPPNMTRAQTKDCQWDIIPLQLSEILPNAFGSDTGNEFIELYNPTDRVVDLSLYSVKVGINSDKVYAFPAGAIIAPGEYQAFSDSAMKFTLVNSTGRVILTAIDGSVLGDSGPYETPSEGESWAMIEGVWTYTNQPTPGYANIPSIVIDAEQTDLNETGPALCPTGKYRHPLTNRCRNIVTDASVLSACDADQYRDPETGRCRKVSTTSLTPCKDGQYRSEETNRCRNISVASTQKPCKDSQYRSEETGRCRNLPTSSVPNAGFAVQPVQEAGKAFVGWWALGGVGLLAAGYAGWEWRRELAGFWKDAVNRFL